MQNTVYLEFNCLCNNQTNTITYIYCVEEENKEKHFIFFCNKVLHFTIDSDSNRIQRHYGQQNNAIFMQPDQSGL